VLPPEAWPFGGRLDDAAQDGVSGRPGPSRT
jgi:hypothetical protein